MTKKLFTLVTVLTLCVAACGSGGTDEGTATVENGGETAGDVAARETPVDGEPPGSSGDGDALGTVTGDLGTAPGALSTGGPLGALLFADGEDPGAYESVRFEARLSAAGETAAEGPIAFDVVIDGDLDLANEAMALRIDLSGLGAVMAAAGESSQIPPGFDSYLADPIEVRVAGREGWLRWSLLGMLTGREDAWLALGAEELGGASDQFGLGTVGTDPLGLLVGIGTARAALDEVGPDTVRGVATTHYRSTIDLAAVAAADPATRAELEGELGSLDGAVLPVELWIDGDGLVRRYSIELASTGLIESFGAVPTPGESFTATLVVELYDHGADLGIEPPPADEVVDAESMFGG
ncbi:MAG: hypothetical protein ACFCVK_08580 [Acidimicrobiales bacterium]